MEIITMESSAFKELTGQINAIAAYVRKLDDSRQENQRPGALLTTEDVMEMLGVSRRTLQRMRSNRVVSYTYSGKSCRYRPEDIERYLDERRTEAGHSSYTPRLGKGKEDADGNT